MKLKKKDLLEIIDANGELIGKDDTPTNGSNLETAANGTTDMNVGKGQQPFRYDMLGRFGFTMMPFFEGKEDNKNHNEMLSDISKELFGLYKEILENYYRHPNLIKSEFRKISQSENNGDEIVNDYIRDNFGKYSKKIIKVVQNHFENAFEEPENIDENAVVEEKVVEDKIVDKKSESEIANKSEDKTIKEKKIEKIAGLINKLEKSDIDTLINLLERK